VPPKERERERRFTTEGEKHSSLSLLRGLSKKCLGFYKQLGLSEGEKEERLQSMGPRYE
jgi:hypothetical protein